MRNKFFFLLLIYSAFCMADIHAQDNSDADRLSQIVPALQSGSASEAQWLEAAMLYEHAQNYPEALYCLKKAAATFGTPGTDARVAQLVKTMGIQRYMLDDTGMQLRRWMARFGPWIWGITVLLTLGAIGLRLKAVKPGWLSPSVASLSMAGILFLSWYHFLIPDYAVVIRPAAYYSGPGYGHLRLPEPAPAGSTVIVESVSDVWTFVDDGRREGWVPSAAIREL